MPEDIYCKLELIVGRHRKGQRPTREERAFVLDSLTHWLGLDNMNRRITDFRKRPSAGSCHYTFAFDGGTEVTIRTATRLQNRRFVLDRMTEALDAAIRPRTIGDLRDPAVQWAAIVDCLLAAVEPVDASEAKTRLAEVTDKATVREWVISFIVSKGVCLDATSAWQDKRPYLEGEHVWFFPQLLAQERNIPTGALRNKLYATLREIGIEDKPKRLPSGKIGRAYRCRWGDFFRSTDEFERNSSTSDDPVEA